jgi:cobalt-zinc-cadmium efflux system protein
LPDFGMTAHRHEPVARGKPAFIAALIATTVYAVIELAGGLWSGSLALVSDAGHMFSDSVALALAATAAWLARRPPGLRHSYGWARAEVIGASLSGLLMLGVIVVLVVEAVERLLVPRPVIGGGVMVIAFFGLLVNGFVAYLLGSGEHNLNTRAALIHVIGDLVGSVAALTAGAVIYFTGWLPIDPILSLAIAGLIFASTLRLLRDAVHVLMEGVPAAIDLEDIGRAMAGVSGVAAVHDLHVWSITSGQVALSAHLEIDDLAAWPRILVDTRDVVRAAFGIDHVTLQPEPRDTTGPRTSVIRLRPRGGP